MMENIEGSTQYIGLYNHKSYRYIAVLVLMFIVATLLRLKNINAPGHLIEREYNSAIFARAFYFQNNDTIEKLRQMSALQTRDQFPLLEPPVTEFIVSVTYRIMGQEVLWYSRYVTTVFWLIGGVFLYQIVKILITCEAAFFAVMYYLFVPMGVIISRSFQPDSIMMMMFLVSLYCILLYSRDLSWRRLILAALCTGITLLLRPLIILPLIGAFIAISISNKRTGIKILDNKFMAFFLLCLAFPVTFYGYGIYIAGFLRGQLDLSFRPWLLTHLRFWRQWFELSTSVVTPSFLVAALVGFLLFLNKHQKLFLIIMGICYLLTGLLFTYHFSTHAYYHIQLFPIIGISAAPFIVHLARLLKKSLGNKWVIPSIVIFLFGLYFSYSQVRDSLYNTTFEDPSLAREIGEIVDHSNRTVFIAYHYGVPLVYYGEFSGAPWPVRIDDAFYRNPNEKERSVQERMDSLGFQPEYFIITDFGRYYRQHQDLKKYLETYCSIYAQTDSLLIYTSCPSINGY